MPAVSTRRPDIDALRGFAMVWMTAYHFCYDLNWLGLWSQNFTAEPLWWIQRSAIVSIFMFCAGYGQALALRDGQAWSRFWRRWAQIAAAAALVSVASWWAFPRSWIYFGVLHAYALMLPLLRVAGPGLLRRRHLLLPAAASVLAATWLAQHWPGTGPAADLLNRAPLNVLGWVSRKPFTEDYVPVLPWVAPLLLGFWTAGLTGPAGGPLQGGLKTTESTGVTCRGVGRLASLGRFGLSYYLLHQPVLLGLLWLLAPLLR